MYCTSEPREDGFGGQFQNILWDILYSENNNLQYVFIQPKVVEHNYSNNPIFIDTLVDYMNVKPTYGIDNFNKESQISIHVNNRGHLYHEIEKNIDRYHSGKVFEKFQSLFFSNKQSPYDINKFNVAIHIRRQNQCDMGDIERSSTTDLYHLKIINRIRLDFKEKNPLFHIYSQGDKAAFNMYEADDTILHLNEDLLNTFNGMVFADILTTTTSSFSYVAALLSKGIIYYQPFWHKPLNKWIVLNI